MEEVTKVAKEVLLSGGNGWHLTCKKLQDFWTTSQGRDNNNYRYGAAWYCIFDDVHYCTTASK
jgi:hypothetical protein